MIVFQSFKGAIAQVEFFNQNQNDSQNQNLPANVKKRYNIQIVNYLGIAIEDFLILTVI